MCGFFIGSRCLGMSEPCFIIAEAGVNHNGEVDLAEQLIEVAADAGADAVKFQTFKADKVVTAYAEKAAYQKKTTSASESQYDMIKRLELKAQDFKHLAKYAKSKNILFLSSPFDKASVDLLADLDVPAFKVASGEITNVDLLRHIARKGRPILLSTGMSTLGDIERALNLIQHSGTSDIILLHCTTNYPAQPAELNLRAIKTLKYAFALPVGFSDHSVGIAASIAAVALGACAIEKHITISKELPGPDHQASSEPAQFKEMVEAVRNVEQALGDGVKRPTRSEEETITVARRSIVAKADIPKGTVITEDMLEVKRPGTGISPQRFEDLKHE